MKAKGNFCFPVKQNESAVSKVGSETSGATQKEQPDKAEQKPFALSCQNLFALFSHFLLPHFLTVRIICSD